MKISVNEFVLDFLVEIDRGRGLIHFNHDGNNCHIKFRGAVIDGLRMCAMEVNRMIDELEGK